MSTSLLKEAMCWGAFAFCGFGFFLGFFYFAIPNVATFRNVARCLCSSVRSLANTLTVGKVRISFFHCYMLLPHQLPHAQSKSRSHVPFPFFAFQISVGM